MHDAFRMHVFQSTADLSKEFPNRFLGERFVLGNEMFDHLLQIARTRQFQNNVQIILFDEMRNVFDHVRMIQMLNEEETTSESGVERFTWRS